MLYNIFLLDLELLALILALLSCEALVRLSVWTWNNVQAWRVNRERLRTLIDQRRLGGNRRGK